MIPPSRDLAVISPITQDFIGDAEGVEYFERAGEDSVCVAGGAGG